MGTKKFGCGSFSKGLCNQCDCDPCSCAALPSCPTPFYNESATCAEDHCRTVVKSSFLPAVKVANSFNMPACGETAALQVDALKGAPLGAVLWSQGVGFLRIISVQITACGSILTVQNDCADGNAAPGTQVPPCTLFTVDAPQQGGTGGSTTGIFVAFDFTAPAVGNCILITVTGVAGLQVNKNVAIGSGTYRINAIPDATHIEICNDGSGLPPGSVVVAKDGSGEYQYPITLIDANPCSNPGVAEGYLIVCNNGIMTPLGVNDSVPIGAVPISIDIDGKVRFEFLDVPTRTCATITCCLTIVTGFAGPYIVPVSDSSQFTVGQFLQIGTRGDRFIVTAIVDGTTLQGTITPVPTATTDVPPGTSICAIDCCEDLQGQLNGLEIRVDDLEDDVADIQGDITDIQTAIVCSPCDQQLTGVFAQTDDPTPTVVNSGNNYDFTDDPFYVVSNTTVTGKNVLFFVNFLARFFGTVQDRPGTFEFRLEYVITFTGPAAPAPIGKAYSFRHSYTDTDATDRPEDEFINVPEVFTLAAGQTASIGVNLQVNHVAGGTVDYNLASSSIILTGAGMSNA